MDPIWCHDQIYSSVQSGDFDGYDGGDPARPVTRSRADRRNPELHLLAGGSGPASSRPPAATKARSSSVSRRNRRPGSFLCDALNADRSRRKEECLAASVVMASIAAVGWEGARRHICLNTGSGGRDGYVMLTSVSIRSFASALSGGMCSNVKSPWLPLHASGFFCGNRAPCDENPCSMLSMPASTASYRSRSTGGR